MNQTSPIDDTTSDRECAPESLDPTDWEAFGETCHRMLDVALAHLQSARTRPLWRPIPDTVKADLHEPLPMEAQGTDSVCTDFCEKVLPYTLGNTHPRFFGWVHGNGTPGGMLAEMLAGAINANTGGREHSPIYVERAVIDWCRQLFRFPESSSGLMVTGTSMATLIALTVARSRYTSHDVRQHGLYDEAPLIVYSSNEAHRCISKSVEILGLGTNHLRSIPVDRHFKMDVDLLRRTIERDRANGATPFCVVGTAGTVNTGAIDDLATLADVCAEEQLWFHVDGAFGAMAILSDDHRLKLTGIELADSIATDFHKWLHVPYDAGCVLIRDGQLHRAAFAAHPDYLVGSERGLAGGMPWYCDYGPELSRGFRALKVWFTLKEHGLRRLGQKISDNCRQSADLARQITQTRDLELLAPVELNIVCFRYAPPDAVGLDLNAINRQIVAALQERAIAAPSTTVLNGNVAIRINLTNHRCQDVDLHVVVDAVCALGFELRSTAK